MCVCVCVVQGFRRDGHDLHMTQRIGLVEALCGFQLAVTHLDGRQLAVKYPPGKVIEPGKTHITSSIYLFGPTCIIKLMIVCVRLYPGGEGRGYASVQEPI